MSEKTVIFPQDRTCPYHPPTAYEPLRTGRPLSRVTLFDGRSVWMVSGHAEARALLSDGRLSADRQNLSFPAPSRRLQDLQDRYTALFGVDGPAHNTQRRMLISSFGLGRTAALRPWIQETVDRLIDALIAAGPRAELVGDFARPVASMVTCEVLGVPYADHEFFMIQSRRLHSGPEATDVDDAREQLNGYLHEFIGRKREKPGGALLDELIVQRLETGEIDVQELADLVSALLVAGHETTASMISLGTFTLLSHPEQLAELRNDPSLMPAAVEELMRFLSIADGLRRVATEDIEVGGVTVRTGDGVIFSTSVINRDEAVFEKPDTLDWHRPSRHHLAFGFGIHQCLGQNLARAEVEIALGTLFERLPGLRLAAEPDRIPFKPGDDTIQGMVELPVAW
ncbi:cytochrome P450 [Streptomyces roseifaciens]|uniref:cytochrome P450 n=1 Tax=Streptomyces roseifaciens TaxID=1488406 RepID=UPI0007180FB4|nr:cytochrome P450 [Streptomyces roseifaciens]